MSALQISGLTKKFGAIEVLKGIELTIESGEFVVLVGPSGCGKTTLLNMIAGLETVSGGTIEIGGRRVNDVPSKDRNIAMIFQSYALYPNMTVRENITFGMECRNVPITEQNRLVAYVARFLQIEPLLKRRPSQLSGGQRQRVAMGRALVRDPLLFLFDEPLSNLDAKLRVEMRMEIKQLHQRLATTTVHVTHDQVEAMTLATRIAVMHRGEVQQFADPRTIYDRPANLFVARFMGSPPMNTLTARLEAAGDHVEAVVESGSSAPHRLPLKDAGDALRPWIDREVIVGVRPECVFEATRRTPEDGRVLTDISAMVEVTEPTGAETMALIRLGNQTMMARLDPDIDPQVGSPMDLRLDMRKACVFDPASERRVA